MAEVENTGWAIDKKVNISHLILVFTLAWGAGAWADDAHDSLNSRMHSMEQTLEHHKSMFTMQQQNTVKKIDKLEITIKDLILEIRKLREST